MAVQVLGKVAYFNKGVYNSQTNYEINDVVSYNGSSYVSLNDNNQGNLPTNTNYWSVVAEKGDKGDTGKPFVIEKTYSTIESMVADYDNMNVNDYVMIQGSIEEQENATLWTKREVEVSPYKWAYLADFSGASGITGATPNIHIGTVTEGNEPSVTRRSGSSNENPILDFVLKTGAKGDTGATGNGISSIEKTSTSGLVDTYTITFTNGTSTTIEVTNGRGIVSIVKTGTVDYVDTYTITYNDGTTSTFEVANSEVTEEEFDDVVDELNYLYDDLPKVEGEGTNLTLDNTRKGKMSNVLKGNTSQKTSILPDGYTQVDYIESSGTQYIDTGVNADINLDINVSLANVNGITFGAIYNNNGSYIRYHTSINNNEYTFFILQGGTIGTISTDINVKHNFYIQASNRTVIVDNTSYTLPANTDTDTNLNFWLFARNSNSSNLITKSSFKLYNCKMYSNNVLIRDFIPCYRNSDNEVGLYDLVNNVFYTNQGTGSFTYGSVVGIPNPDYPQDVHVVSGGNTIRIESKNLFNPTYEVEKQYDVYGNERTVTYYFLNNNGISSSRSNNTYGACFFNKLYLEAGTYTFSLNMSQSGNTTTNVRARIRNFDTSTDFVSTNVVVTSNKWSYTFTLTKPTTIGLMALPSSDSDGTLYLSNIQLEKGSGVTDFYPYVSQNYPINLGTTELCKIGNYQDYIAKSTGKNLFDVNNPMYVNKPLQGDGVVSGSSSTSNVSQYIQVRENTNYTLSLTNDNNSRRISFYSKELTSEVATEDVISTISYNGNTTTFKTPIGCKYIRFSYYQTSTDVQLEKNSIATDYEPYGKGKWYKHSEIGKQILDGSETYDPSSTNTSGKYRIAYKGISNIILAPPNASTKGNILCDYFEVKTANQTYQCQQGISVATNGDIQIYNLNNEIGSVNAFKTWLSNNNTSIYYVLATPTNTEITDQTLIAQLDNFEKAISYNTQTNISQENNDLPFIISASAFMSLKYIFSNLETRVAELEG